MSRASPRIRKAPGKLTPRKSVASSEMVMDAESIALANNPKFVAIIERTRARYKTEGGVSLQEVRRRLGIPVKSKRRKPI